MPQADRAHASFVEEAGAEMRVAGPALFWSALGAGLAIAFSFIAAAGAYAAAPEGWQAMAAALAYPVGFVMVIGGRYQLYTENTNPPVLRVLERLTTVPALLRLWAIVLAGNAVGAVLVGSALALPGLLPAELVEAAPHVASVLHDTSLGVVFGRAVLAGWLVAALVWLLHRMEGGELPLIWAMITVMPLLHLEHIVVGTVEASWAVASGLLAIGPALAHLAVTLVGNTVGGVVLVAVVNVARTREVHPQIERLDLQTWLFSFQCAPDPELPDTRVGT
jgi:formate/nitrite transporter FocA (FNT family)